MSNHSEIVLNMLLDHATEILESSSWATVEEADGSFSVTDPTGCILTGIKTREVAELVIRDWNTPKRQASRVAAVRRAYASRFTTWADC